MGKANIPSIVYSKPPPAVVVSCEQGNVVAPAAPDISRLTAEMLEAADLDDLSAGSDGDDAELDTKKLVIDDMDWTQTPKRYAVTIIKAEQAKRFQSVGVFLFPSVWAPIDSSLAIAN